LTKSSLGILKVGSRVNLERSVKLSDRLGGHLVQGHINGVSRISKIEKLGENYFLFSEIPPDLKKYIVPEGSIALDGISLTVAEIKGVEIGLSIIPHTWENTTLKFRTRGDILNVEIDIIAKYIEKLMKYRESSDDRKFTDGWLKELGY
jgi:riboflavin synthase